jgi:hypothetical protein
VLPAVNPIDSRYGVIRSRVGCVRTTASALLVALGIGPRDGRFQTSATPGEYLKLRLHALLFDLKLAATRFTQIFWMRATHTRQTTLDVFRLEIFFELLKTRLQFSLLCLRLD